MGKRMWAKLYSILCLILLGTSHAVNARDISIFSNDFASHVKEAKPGDTLIIEPGTYWITKEVKLDIAGTEINPITIKPAPVGKVTIYSDSRVVFKVEAPYWTIENLDIIGKCGDHGKCEHALHITGHADHTTIRGNRLIDFNAQIKGNGLIEDRRQYFPDHVLIENNQLYNRSSRDTGNPVTPIDVVGGRFWTIRDNFIADFHKGRGNQISYAAFLKGNSDNGVFERNLIICERGLRVQCDTQWGETYGKARQTIWG